MKRSGARMYFARILTALVLSVTVENIAGASGTIGLELFGTHAIVPNPRNPPLYDALLDFVPVNYIGNAWDILIVPPRVTAKTVPEPMSMARERPDALTYGSIGIGQPAHFLGLLLTRSAGVRITHVPYKGSAPAVTDLLGERISMMFASTGAIVPYLKDGRLRALAITASKRSPPLPDVPTFKEIGMPELELLTWLGVFAPAKTPPQMVAKVSGDLSRVLALPDIRAKLAAQFLDPMGSTPLQFAAFLGNEVPRWQAIVKDSGVRAE